MYLEKLELEIENYCSETGYDIVKAKRIILENKGALKAWIENTKIVDKEGKLDDAYYQRTVEGVLRNE